MEKKYLKKRFKTEAYAPCMTATIDWFYKNWVTYLHTALD